MAAYNRVILVGNITREIELTKAQGGTAVTDIGLAVNERRKNQAGDWVEDTQFIDVTMWGRTAEVAAKYLGKGSPILIEGRLRLETWEKDGQQRSKLKVIGERLQMLGKSKATSLPANENADAAAVTDDAPLIVMAGAPEDDVPF